MMGWFLGAGGGGDPEFELTSSHMRETSGTFPLCVQGEEDTGTLGGGFAAEDEVRAPQFPEHILKGTVHWLMGPNSGSG